MTNRTLMAIFAHPDDEAFGTGGTLAKYAHEGVDVHLVTATLGEAGQMASSDITLTAPLSLLREQELRCACEQYGGITLHLLGYMDGQTAIVPLSLAVYKIVKLIRQLKPDVLFTFGPDGIYGHFDHLVVHRWTMAAITLAAQADKWPTAGAAHEVSKVYYRVLPEEQVERMTQTLGQRSVPMDGEVPFPFVGYPPEQITTIIDVHEYAEAKLKGIRCHASQLGPHIPYLQKEFDYRTDPSFSEETFQLVQSSVERPSTEKEADLFAGL